MVPVSALSKLVLQPADLPSGFFPFDVGKQVTVDAPPGQRASPTRFGREGGWKARYRRSQPAGRGPFIVESRADLFAADEGAEDDLAALRTQLTGEARAGGVAVRIHPEPDLGEEAVAASTLQGSGTAALRFVTIGWRDGNVTASVLVAGTEGGLTPADAVRLARKQQGRIEKVASE